MLNQLQFCYCSNFYKSLSLKTFSRTSIPERYLIGIETMDFFGGGGGGEISLKLIFKNI